MNALPSAVVTDGNFDQFDSWTASKIWANGMPLANAFLKRFAGQANRPLRGFTQSAVDRLTSFDWPGNVRQLQNEIQRAVLLCEGEMIDGADLSITRTKPDGAEPQDTNFTLLDWTPLGRQETWEDSPPGWPQSEPYVWWRRHDDY